MKFDAQSHSSPCINIILIFIFIIVVFRAFRHNQFALNFGGIMVIVGVINIWLMIPTILMIIVFYLLRIVYVRSGRSLKRIEALSKQNKYLLT